MGAPIDQNRKAEAGPNPDRDDDWFALLAVLRLR
jgi:hypothetical protein